MIKAIIFDFGNVFINLDIEGTTKHILKTLKIDRIPEEMIALNNLYEQGLITTEEFLEFYTENFPHITKANHIVLWNYLLREFPKARLDWLKQLKQEGKYQLILLSNTNTLHIEWVKQQVPFFDDFKACFNAFYLSYEIGMRKPDRVIFEFVLKENNLSPEACLFIDDNKDNIHTANTMGFHTWHIHPTNEEVCNLFKTKTNLL